MPREAGSGAPSCGANGPDVRNRRRER
jgi:hypothetical protein